MRSKSQEQREPRDEQGIPITVLEPRHGQVIVAPHPDPRRGPSRIALPERAAHQILIETVALVVATGPGRVAPMTGQRCDLELDRGDLVVLVQSDMGPDGTMPVKDPFSDLKLLAVDEQSIIARYKPGTRERLEAEANAMQGRLNVVGGE